MLRAIDNYGKRVLPKKGLEAYCPICHEQVFAFCGEIYIHHWKHAIDRDCDPWQEPETEWHRQWKIEFPDNWQEVVITRNHDTHRADVMTNSGLVVEFQNSFISASDIKERERFYGKMIWVINAKAFKDNFRIQSMVSFYLRLNDSDNYQLPEPDYEPLKKDLKHIENEIKDIQYKIQSKESDIKYYTQKAENLSQSVSAFLNDPPSIASTVIKIRYFKLKTNINEKTNEIEDCHKTLNFIDTLKKCNIAGLENYRFVEFSNIKPSDFNKCKIIERSTLKSEPLFPTIIDIKSEQEFLNFKLYLDKYSILANVTLSIKAMQAEIEAKTLEIENLQKEMIDIEEEVSNDLDREYTLKIEALEMELNEMLDDLGNLQVKLSDENSKYLQEINYLNAQRTKVLESLHKQKDQTRLNIMKQYKGIYTYRWKHRRKSWDFSTKTIFLDFETHLFAVLEDDTLKKVSRDDFIKDIKNWK